MKRSCRQHDVKLFVSHNGAQSVLKRQGVPWLAKGLTSTAAQRSANPSRRIPMLLRNGCGGREIDQVVGAFKLF